MRILAVGYRFFEHAHEGDKTFWLNLLREVAARGSEVHVVSVDVNQRPTSYIGPGLSLENVKARRVTPMGPGTAGRYAEDPEEVASVINYMSKSVTLPRLARLIRRMNRDWSADVVHFMDNMGPASLVFADRLKVPTYTSAVTYDARYPLYDRFLAASFGAFQGIAASSDSFRKRLVDIGVSSRRVRTIRWGVPSENARPDTDQLAAKRTLGISPRTPVVLWSGYLQQSGPEDLALAHRAVAEAEEEVGDLVAYLCLKPVHYRDAHRDLEGPRTHVRGDAKSFLLARRAADVFLNPMTRTSSILAPPLTWVECMMKGIPILTTECGGVEEALGKGTAGDVVPPENLGHHLADLFRNPSRLQELSRGAHEWAMRQYTLDAAIDNYMTLWAGDG